VVRASKTAALARSVRTLALTVKEAALVLKSPPAGYRTMHDFGTRLGWGDGAHALQTALVRAQTLTPNQARDLAISSSQAFLIRDAYRAVLNSSKGTRNGVTINEAALGREVLLHNLGLILGKAGL